MDAMGRKNLWCSKAKRKKDVQVSICNTIYLKKKRPVEHASGSWGKGGCENIYHVLGNCSFLPTQLSVLGLVGYTWLK